MTRRAYLEEAQLALLRERAATAGATLRVHTDAVGEATFHLPDRSFGDVLGLESYLSQVEEFQREQ